MPMIICSLLDDVIAYLMTELSMVSRRLRLLVSALFVPIFCHCSFWFALCFCAQAYGQMSGGIPPPVRQSDSSGAASSRSGSTKDSRSLPASPRQPTYVKLDTFTVNLPANRVSRELGAQVLQIDIFLRVLDMTVYDKIKEFLPVVQDRIITVLSARPGEQLKTVEAKEIIGKEIALVVNSIVEPQLTAIYVLQQQPSRADLRHLVRIGVIPKDAAETVQTTQVAIEAAAQFRRIGETDLPVHGTLFKSFVLK